MSRNLKNLGLVSSLTMVSRVLGLVRDRMTAGLFTTSQLMSAFVTGLTLPNLFRRLLAEGGLTAAFVPTLHDQLATGGEVDGAPSSVGKQRAFVLVNQVVSWQCLVTGGIVIAAMLLFSWKGGIEWAAEASGAEPGTVERWLLAAHFTVILFPYLLFVSLAAAFSAALQSLHRFLEPALSPIWLNVTIIALLVISGVAAPGQPQVQIYWFAAGWLIGGFLQMVVPAMGLMREGWRPRFDLTVSDPLRAMVRLMVPTLFSSSIYLVNMSASRLVGISLNDQAVAVLNFAQRLMELPIGVFAVAVSTVVFPLISRYAAIGDHANLATAYRKGMRLILLINVPAAVGLVVLATPIVRVILQNGRFGAADTAATAPVLIANAVGLPFLSFASLALRAFYARKDMVRPVQAALLSFFVNLGLSVALMGRYATVGLAVASSVAAVAQAAYLQWQLARTESGLAFRHLAKDLFKIVVAAGVMGVLVATAWVGWVLMFRDTLALTLLGLSGVIALGITIYGAAVWIMRVEGRDDVAAVLSKVRGKLSRKTGA